MGDKTVRVIEIPRMTKAAYDFFTQQLKAFEAAIIVGNGTET